MSAASSTMTASGVPVGMSLVPASTSSDATKPSSWFSKGSVALSVSISASTCPALISSPADTAHDIRLPFSIVGESAGMSSIVKTTPGGGSPEPPAVGAELPVSAAAGGVVEAAEAPPSALYDANLATSAASSTTMATTSPTCTFCAPSATRILAMKPSSWFSNAIVALSVSMSASTSPAAISSPSPLYHLDRLPCVMVGDSEGNSSFV
mmetsp:Transcript_18537/g.47460  ORF Transcript_18537/g.47460 Transcript_18537/m.47460 type:complete len:209 (+) Transcript_18537:1122-1748(+)